MTARRTIEAFHAASSVQVWQMETIEALSNSAASWPAEWSTIYQKGFPRANSIELPPAPELPAQTLQDVLSRRGSERSPIEDVLTLTEISTLLAVAFGERANADERSWARRSYPSAGARFPVELYLVTQRVAELTSGVYHYDFAHHALEAVRQEPTLNPVLRCFGQEWISRSRTIFVLTSVQERSAMKYGARSYRYALIEAGHITQNLLLAASAMQIPATPVGGFADVGLAHYLDLGDVYELPIYACVLP